MYKEIESLKPYFYSIREIKNALCLDLKIPLIWKYEINEILEKYPSVKIKSQDKDMNVILISLISESNYDGCDNIMNCARDIIKFNKEEEEKKKLFNEKMNELQNMFKNKSLDELKNLDFINENGRNENSQLGGNIEPEIEKD